MDLVNYFMFYLVEGSLFILKSVTILCYYYSTLDDVDTLNLPKLYLSTDYFHASLFFYE